MGAGEVEVEIDEAVIKRGLQWYTADEEYSSGSIEFYRGLDEYIRGSYDEDLGCHDIYLESEMEFPERDARLIQMNWIRLYQAS